MNATHSSEKPDDSRVKRLVYRSIHRGCKETDLIFAQFANNTLTSLDSQQLDIYEELLEEFDADIWLWIVGKAEIPRPEYEPLVAMLRTYQPPEG